MATDISQVLFICLLFCALSWSRSSDAVSSGNVVTYLPGLAVQPLPFHLETGYIGVSGNDGSSAQGDIPDGEGANQLFYYFVESERNPREDPLVLWLTGGPRCSGLSPLVFKRGPIQIDKAVEYKNGSSLPTFSLNPYSWTKIANMIFLDQPVGAGFSYYSNSSDESGMGDILSARNTCEFLVKWLIQNPEFQSNSLYISGDSYSGIIIPIIVQDLIRDIEAGKYPFLNFKGFTLGNPATYGRLEENSYVPFAYGLGFVSYELYQSMRENCIGDFLDFDLSNRNCTNDRQELENLISRINRNQVLEPLCDETFITSPNPKETTKNRRRRSLVRTEEASVGAGKLHRFRASCSREYTYVLLEHWANDNEVQKALHVKEGTIKKWMRCNYGLSYEYEFKSVVEHHQNISTKGYRSIVYSGDHDMIIPHISTEAWIRTLANLSITEEWRPWFVDGQVAGYTRTYSNGLTYATVKGGGHTAPEYNPKESYHMFERWITNAPL